MCLEDGVSKEMISNFSESNPYFVTQILSAVPQGCHTYSFSVSGSDPFSFSDIFCLPVQGEVNAGLCVCVDFIILFFLLVGLVVLVC